MTQLTTNSFIPAQQMIKAEVVAGSIHAITGKKDFTMLCVIPRMILAELNTHRMFARNSASSRAIPVKRMIASTMETPFVPLAWGKTHSGMSSIDYVRDPEEIQIEINDWLEDRNYVVRKAQGRLDRGITKQLANRPLETFMYHTVIISATEWENFFNQRCPRYDFGDGKIFKSKFDALVNFMGLDFYDQLSNYSILDWIDRDKCGAEIHIKALAEAILDAQNSYDCKVLQPGDFHIPYENKIHIPLEGFEFSTDKELLEMKIKISTVMCARTSYISIDQDMSEWTVERYLQKYDELKNADPVHASPFEHVHQAMTEEELQNWTYQQGMGGKLIEGYCDYLRDFIPLRRLIGAA